MRTSSLSFKLIFLAVGMIILVTSVFSALTYINFRDIFTRQLVNKGVQLADFFNKHSSVSYGIVAEEKFLLSEAIDLFMRDPDVVYAAALNREGRTIAFKTKDDTIVKDIEWFLSGILSDGKFRSKGIFEKATATGENLILFVYPVVSEKKELPFGQATDEGVNGYTVLAFTLKNFYSEFYQRIKNMLIVVIFIVITSTIVITYLIRGNVKPLLQLKDQAESISKEGNLRQKVEAETGDEVQELAEAFSRMVDILRLQIRRIKEISERLVEVSQDIYKNSSRIREKNNEQSLEISSIVSLVEGVRDTEIGIAAYFDSISSDLGKVYREILEIEGILSYISDRLRSATQGTDEISTRGDEIKEAIEQLGKLDKILSDVEQIGSSFNSLKDTVSSAKNDFQYIYSRISDIAEQGLQQIASDTDSIDSTINNLTNVRNDVLKLAYDVQKDIDEVLRLVFEFLDFIDDTNMLAINASIIASHQGEKGGEFGVVAEEIKKLALGTEESVQNMKNKLKAMKQKVYNISRMVESSMEESLTDLSNSREGIGGGISKLRTFLDDIKVKINSGLSEFDSAYHLIAKAGSTISSVQELSYKIVKVLDTTKRKADEISYLSKEVADILSISSGDFQSISDKINSSKLVFDRLTADLLSIKNDLGTQLTKIEELKSKVLNLENMVYEINKISEYLSSRSRMFSDYGVKLEEVTKHYKT